MPAKSNQSNPFEFFYENMKQYAPQGINMEQMLTQYRRNMEVLACAQKATFELMQETMKSNAEFSKGMMEDMRSHYQSMISARSLEERARMQANKMKESMEAVMQHGQNLAQKWSKSGSSMGQNFQENFKDNAKEAQNFAEKAMRRN